MQTTSPTRTTTRKATARRRTEPRVLLFTEFAERVLCLKLDKGQRVFCRIAFDCADPIDLPEDERAIALDMFGEVDRVPAGARSTIVARCGRGSGKSTLAAAYGVYRACIADLSHCGPGDTAAIVVVSTRLGDNSHGGGGAAKEVVDKALALAQASPYLSKCIADPTIKGFALAVPGRRRVRFISAPKSLGGKALRGISIVDAILDESEFIAPSDAASGITDGATISAIRPRLVPNGRVMLLSTPWPATSTTSELFDANFGNPVHALAARARTLVMRDFRADLVKSYEAELAGPRPSNALREWDCVVVDEGNCFFEASTIDEATVDVAPAPLRTGLSTGGIDLAFRCDSAALVAIERQGRTVMVFDPVIDKPPKGAPLKPSVICARYVSHAFTLGVKMLVADNHYIDSATEAAADTNMSIVAGPTMTGDKFKAFERLRRLLRERRIKIPRGPIVAQLKSVLKREQSGGVTKIILPRTGAGHADAVSALVNAVWLDRRFGDTGTDVEVTGAAPVGARPFDGIVTGGAPAAPPSLSINRNPFSIPSGWTRF